MTIRRPLAPAFAGLILLAGVAACSDAKPEARSPLMPSPSSSTPAAGGTGTVPPGSTSSPGASAPARGTAPGSTSAPAPAPGAKPFVPRPPGTYSYATSGQTRLSGAIRRTYEMPPRTTLAIDPASGGAQRSLRDMRDGDGSGRLTETVFRISSDGLHLAFLKNTTTLAGVKDERVFVPNPPPLVIRTGAPAGDRVSFTIQGSGITATTDVEVLRRESITIGGAAIQAVVVRLHTTFSGDVEGEETATNWLRPADGLLLREDVSSNVAAGFTQVRTNYTATLERPTPA
jgi:hypothetical protein